MPICVISTVGQSVFNNAGDYFRRQARDFSGRVDVDLSAIANRKKNDFDGKGLYEETLARLWAISSVDALRAASAELNSLQRILEDREAHKSDTLYFLASETPDGALAARVMADFCAEHFNRETEVCLVYGLQVNDGERFRWLGLRNLIDTLYDILDRNPSGTFTRVLNPTGGFKGVVPYLTVVGMLEPEVEVSYIYERSPDLITLEGLPLKLDFDALEGAYEALAACQRESLLKESELARLLNLAGQHVSDHPTWSLFEMVEDNGERLYALNGLGQIVYRHLSEGRDQATVYLSRQAAETYDKLDKTRQRAFGKLIEQIKQGEWRRGKRHGKKGDALIFKQPRADERILYFWDEDENVVLIAELAGHKDSTYSGPDTLRRKDYDKFRKWEGS